MKKIRERLKRVTAIVMALLVTCSMVEPGFMTVMAAEEGVRATTSANIRIGTDRPVELTDGVYKDKGITLTKTGDRHYRLELNNASIGGSGIAIGYATYVDIVLSGNNTINATEENYTGLARGLYIDQSTVTVSGEGSLSINGSFEAYRAYRGDLILNSGTLTFKSTVYLELNGSDLVLNGGVLNLNGSLAGDGKFAYNSGELNIGDDVTIGENFKFSPKFSYPKGKELTKPNGTQKIDLSELFSVSDCKTEPTYHIVKQENGGEATINGKILTVNSSGTFVVKAAIAADKITKSANSENVTIVVQKKTIEGLYLSDFYNGVYDGYFHKAFTLNGTLPEGATVISDVLSDTTGTNYRLSDHSVRYVNETGTLKVTVRAPGYDDWIGTGRIVVKPHTITETPPEVVLKSHTMTSITINTVKPPRLGTGTEYRISGGDLDKARDWETTDNTQNTLTFSGLSPDTTYTVETRYCSGVNSVSDGKTTRTELKTAAVEKGWIEELHMDDFYYGGTPSTPTAKAAGSEVITYSYVSGRRFPEEISEQYWRSTPENSRGRGYVRAVVKGGASDGLTAYYEYNVKNPVVKPVFKIRSNKTYDGTTKVNSDQLSFELKYIHGYDGVFQAYNLTKGATYTAEYNSAKASEADKIIVSNVSLNTSAVDVENDFPIILEGAKIEKGNPKNEFGNMTNTAQAIIDKEVLISGLNSSIDTITLPEGYYLSTSDKKVYLGSSTYYLGFSENENYIYGGTIGRVNLFGRPQITAENSVVESGKSPVIKLYYDAVFDDNAVSFENIGGFGDDVTFTAERDGHTFTATTTDTIAPGTYEVTGTLDRNGQLCESIPISITVTEGPIIVPEVPELTIEADGVNTLADISLPENFRWKGSNGKKKVVYGTTTYMAVYNSEKTYHKDVNVELTVIGTDKTAPKGELTDGNNRWNQFLNVITFKLLFKETQTYTLSTVENGSGIAKTEYFLSEKALTEESVKNISGWTKFDTNFSVNPSRKFIAYVKITDKAGNDTVISSDGIIIDNAAPTFEVSIGTDVLVANKVKDVAADTNGSAVLNVTAKDNVSGLKSITYIDNDGASQNATTTEVWNTSSVTSGEGRITLDKGKHTLSITVTDNMGNSATQNYKVNVLETIVPTISAKTNVTYDGLPVEDGIDFSLDRKSSSGAVTYYYKLSSGKTWKEGLPTDAGSYSIKAKLEKDSVNLYAEAETAPTTIVIDKALHKPATVKGTAEYGTTGMVDISAAVDSGGTVAIKKDGITDKSLILSGAPTLEGKKLSFTFKGNAKKGASATIALAVKNAKNYTDYEILVTATVSNKDVPKLVVSSINHVYTGNAIKLANYSKKWKAMVGSESVTGRWTFKKSGVVLKSVPDSGKYTVVFTPDNRDSYIKVETPVTVNITKATPTGKPAYTKITAAGKKLSGARLTKGTIAVAGTISWNAGASTVAIANKAYGWTFTPKDSVNYKQIKGTIIPYVPQQVVGTINLRPHLKATKSSITITWNRVKKADGYIVYASKCENNTLKKVKTIKNAATTKYVLKDLKLGKYYKVKIKAYKVVNGKNVILEQSHVIHAATTGGKFGRIVKVYNVAKSVTIKKGKTYKLNPKQSVTKVIQVHTNKFRYETSNSKIAKVSSKGKITAVGKGTCTVYVFAEDGQYKKIKVTVK